MSCELETNTNSEGGWKEGKAGEGLAQSEDKMGRMGTPPGAAEEHKHCNSWGPACSAHATSRPGRGRPGRDGMSQGAREKGVGQEGPWHPQRTKDSHLQSVRSREKPV